ncbi:hypothetical protein PU629_13780 [Pullulanibacillus sp. KACC 23026]|uniref:MotE family protein n=1 Tax=Pullulanibacillus sp. KACC 23026 TaxID=3028315 RepID=UPI0023B05181|nr:hypothetical protein [Pullulanibacillus sp. KACC 23026]WEG11232.1 hypothetical protein PU629_13780 [Pullulanibacillus sp. KACC 23026]
MNEKSRFKGFLLSYVLIPIILAIVFTGAILYVMKVPVGKPLQSLGSKIPGLSLFIPAPVPTSSEAQSSTNSMKQATASNTSEVKSQKQEITQLKAELSSSKQDLQKANSKVTSLQKQIKTTNTQNYQDQMKKMSQIYSNMSPSKAGAIFDAMPLEDAAYTISMLSQDVQSSILGSMKDPSKAAQITTVLNDLAEQPASDQTSLKDQVHQIVQKNETQNNSLVETLSEMPATQSAGIIKTMMGSDSQSAMTILKDMNTSTRSSILTEITKSNPKMAAVITAELK